MKIVNADAGRAARCLYRCFIVDTGYFKPTCYAEILAFVNLSGVSVQSARDLPPGILSTQLGSTIYLAHDMKDAALSAALAYEWAHILCNKHDVGTCSLIVSRAMDVDCIAEAFRRLF